MNPLLNTWSTQRLQSMYKILLSKCINQEKDQWFQKDEPWNIMKVIINKWKKWVTVVTLPRTGHPAKIKCCHKTYYNIKEAAKIFFRFWAHPECNNDLDISGLGIAGHKHFHTKKKNTQVYLNHLKPWGKMYYCLKTKVDYLCNS